jgi:hypothetical protein
MACVAEAAPSIRVGNPVAFPEQPSVIERRPGVDAMIDSNGVVRAGFWVKEEHPSEGAEIIVSSFNAALFRLRFLPTGQTSKSTFIYETLQKLASKPEAAVSMFLIRSVVILLRDILDPPDQGEDHVDDDDDVGDRVYAVTVRGGSHLFPASPAKPPVARDADTDSDLCALPSESDKVHADFKRCLDLCGNSEASSDELSLSFFEVIEGTERTIHLNYVRRAALLMRLLQVSQVSFCVLFHHCISTCTHFLFVCSMYADTLPISYSYRTQV